MAGEVRCTVDDLLDRTVLEVEGRGIVTPNFITSDGKQNCRRFLSIVFMKKTNVFPAGDTDEDVSTQTALAKKLTTFAEIARQKEWLQEAETICKSAAINPREKN